ncbi:PPC domain-containing protein [Singulisphaera rosea]
MPQVIEVEPNGGAMEAGRLSIGQAVAGTLRARDLDVYRFPAVRGQRITIEVEARRLGIPLSPVLTVFDAKGRSLTQARGSPADGDCRLDFRVPADGEYLLQVHDRVYRGAENAGYRLRLDPARFATGIFPLGGPRARSMLVEAGGGSLDRPLSRFVDLPEEAGIPVEFPGINDSNRWVVVPQRMVAGPGGEELYERPTDHNRYSIHLPFDKTANGRIEHTGERDRYVVAVERGRPVRIKVDASSLGSWLDSIITVRDEARTVLGENDDFESSPAAAGGVAFPGSRKQAVDSRLDFVPGSSGNVEVEIRDRYGKGGPEYSYRLSVGPPTFELSAAFRIEPAETDTKETSSQPNSSESGSRPAVEALNLRPNTETSLFVAVRTEGRPRPIRIQVQGLPPGVRANPLTLRPRGVRGAEDSRATATARITLQVAPEAKPSGGVVRVEASCVRDDGTTLTRPAILTIVRNPPGSIGSDRPIVEELGEIPYRVLETPR